MPNSDVIRILHLEDNSRDAALIQDLLQEHDERYQIVVATNRKQFETALENDRFDLTICDFNLADFDGISALKLAKQRCPEIPVIIVSGAIDADDAVECLKNGATDYLLKQRLERLPSAVARALVDAEQQHKVSLAQERLIESEERFRQLAESIDEVFWMLSLEKKNIIYVSPAYERIWGQPCQSLFANSRAWLDAVHPEVRERVAHAAAVHQEEGKYNEEYRIIRPDGAIGWIHDRGFPVRDKTGKLCRFAGVARDITERKKAQLEAKRQAKQFHDLFEFAPDAMVMANREGNIVMVNQKTEELFGFQRNELIGQPVLILIPTENHAAHIAHKQNYLQDPTPRPMLEDGANPCGRKKDGTTFPVEINLRPIETDAGSVVVASIRDVSDRLKMEEAMREALATLDLTADSVFIFDSDTLRFSYVNEGATRQLGYSRSELMKMTPLDIKSEFNETQFRELVEPLRTGAKSVLNVSTNQRRKDGTTLPVDVNLQYVVSPGGRSCFVAIARDITERKRREAQMLRTQRLESIGTLASGVAHDLNNALAPILMSVEMFRLQYPQEDSMLDIVELSAKRGADMVRQLLTFAKGVEGERLLIQPSRLLREMQGIIKSTFPKNIQLESDFENDLSTIVGDVTQLHQVLLNLCVNARDAMPNGGRLTLGAEDIEIDATYTSASTEVAPGKYVLWQVQDTGIGIPLEIQERIFEPFFTTKGHDKGTGLGLSTVVGIVKSHGGFVRVYSVPGQGTTFAVYLPASDTASSAPTLTKEESLFRGNGETILVVDDEANVREVMRTVLTALHFKVVTATDGTDALVKVAEKRAELAVVITDCHMPHMDGLNFTRVLKHMAPGAKIIVTSGRLGEHEVGEFKAIGVNSLLEKPFTQNKLVETLKDVFHK